MRERLILAVLAMVLLAACGEPQVPLEVPERAFDQVILDQAGILDESDNELLRALADLRVQGWDPVLVTFEASDASMGMADRAGRKVIDAWGADLAIVAVAEPGDFTSESEDRQRFFGLFARDVRDVPRGVRERIVEELAPPIAASNDWTALFVTATQELARTLGQVDEGVR